MATKVLGPVGSKRRRRFLFAPVLLVACTALFWIAGAQAVHDAGVFQLDGNAQTSVDWPNPPGPVGLEDWDKVCPTASPPSRPQSDPVHCLGGTTASRSVFIPDGFEQAGDDIFKGGTDDADVNTWQWKQAKPSPDKADIEQAYAAQYTVTAAGPYQNHKILYFGGTRLANDGNTNIGFWFFQNAVTTNGDKSVKDPTTGAISCPVNSGCGFSGVHKVGNVSLGGNIPGDIFILSAFTNGGAQPTIKIFEWVGPGNATKNYLGSNNCFTNACTLQPLAIPNTPGFTDNRCAPGASEDVACALVNGTSQPSPWFFKDKTTGAPANTFGPAEFYEGGLDLTGLGFGDACFQSTLLNTRSSQSGTSVLQDFAIGGFGSCTSGIVTTPQAGDGGAIPSKIGANARVAVRDHAEITVNGISGAFGGTVTFSLCGPLAASTTENCSTGGVQIGQPVTVSGNNGAAAVNSDTATVTAAGRYCWRAVYSGDSAKQVPGSSDPSKSVAAGGTTSECFTIGPEQPTLTTSAGPDVILGNPITDTATVTGTAKQPGTGGLGGAETIAPGSINADASTQAPAAGTITWTLKGPDNCNDAGLAINGTPATVAGDGTYGPVDATPTAIGKYTWVASYSGNGPNTLAAGPSSCPPTQADGDEEVIVTGVAKLTTEQDWLPNDTATLTGDTNLNGTLTFQLYTGDNCGATSGGPVSGQSYSITVTNKASGSTFSTSNTTFKVKAADAGSYSWKVVYDDANLEDPAPRCEKSSLTITD